jgi:RHS repeat-associated protein
MKSTLHQARGEWRVARVSCLILLLSTGCWRSAAQNAANASKHSSRKPESEAGATRASFGELTNVVATRSPNQNDGIIDPRSGKIFLAATDLTVPAGPVTLEIRRIWQTTPGQSGLLGKRWRMNYESRLVRAGSLAVIYETLGAILFSATQDAEHYTAPAGDALIVEGERAVRRKPDRTEETFDGQGRLVARKDRNGNAIALRYADNGSLSRIEGPYHAFLDFVCDEKGRLIEVKSSTGSSVHYSYDSPDEKVNSDESLHYEYGLDGSLDAIHNPATGTCKFEYDHQGRVTSRQLAGAREQFEYDDKNYVVRHVDPEGRATITSWSADHQKAETTDASGAKSIIEYNVAGQPISLTGPTGLVSRFRYDSLGRTLATESANTGAVHFEYLGESPFISSLTGPDGDKQIWEYDDHSNLLHITSGKQPCPPTMFEYYPNGLMKRSRTCGNVWVTTIYNSEGRPATVTDETGRSWKFEYNEHGNLIRETNPLGQLTTRTYDARGQISSVTTPAGGTTRFQYSRGGQLIESIDPLGVETRYEHDQCGRIVAAIVSGKRSTRYEYCANGQIKTLTDSGGGITRFEYDAEGRLVRTTDPLGGTVAQTYDALGRVIAFTDSAGMVTKFTYSPVGRIESCVDSSGKTTKYSYDPAGRVTTITNGRDQQIRYEYTAKGQLAKLIPSNGPSLGYEYDDSGNVVSVRRGDTLILQYEYDAVGRRTKEKHATGWRIETTYDALGKVLTTADNLGAQSKLQYSANGRLAQAVDSTGGTTRMRYDLAGNLLNVTDPLGNSRHLTYDATGDLSRVEEASGDQAAYEYDPAGRLWKIHHPAGGETLLEYDVVGHVTRGIDPLGRARTAKYGAGGRTSSITNAKGETTQFVYSSAGRLLEKHRGDGKVVTYRYDGDGNCIEIDDGAFPIRYSYSASGQLTSVEYPALKRTLHYEYDPLGQRTRLAISNGPTIDYEYDAFGRLISIKKSAEVVRFAYDAKNRLTSVQYPNGITGRWQYDAFDQVTGLSYADAAGKTIASWEYKYDLNGNCTEAKDSKGQVKSYRYEKANQLVEETAPGGTSTKYSYLPGGNRGKQQSGEQSVAYQYDKADELTQADNETFRYDANGNLIERRGPKGPTLYNYSSDNQLVRVVLPDNSEILFGYAPTGERVWRKDAKGLTYYVNDGANLVEELSEDLKPRAEYVHSLGIDRPFIMSRNDKDYFYLADPLGSIVRLTDDKGNVAAAYDYDAFGNMTSNGNIPNPFTFVGREFDAALGKYYYRLRYYDPKLGRFLSPDPVRNNLFEPLNLNSYTYVLNNPLKYTDPLGAVPNPDLNRINAVLEQHGYGPNAVQDYNRNMPSGTGAHAQWDPTTSTTSVTFGPESTYTNGELDTAKILSSYNHERIGHDLINQRPAPINKSDPAAIASEVERIQSQGGMVSRGLTGEQYGWSREMTNRYGADAGLAIEEAGAYAREAAFNNRQLNQMGFLEGLQSPELDLRNTALGQSAGEIGKATWEGGLEAGGEALRNAYPRKAPPSASEFLTGQPRVGFVAAAATLTIVLTAKQLGQCTAEGRSVADCALDIAKDAAEGTLIAVITPEGAVLLSGYIIGKQYVEAGAEVIEDAIDYRQRSSQTAARNAQRAAIEKQLGSDLARFDARIKSLEELKASIPPARAAADAQAKPTFDAQTAAVNDLAKLETQLTAIADSLSDVSLAPGIKKDSQGYADKAHENYQLLEKGLNSADAMANNIKSEDEAKQILDAWETAQGLARGIAAEATQAARRNDALKEVAGKIASYNDAVAAAKATATTISGDADAASANIAPTKEKVAAADKLKNDLDDAVAALKKDINKIRGAYEDTVEHVFLSDEYGEKPDVKTGFDALLARVDAAAALPAWTDPDETTAAAALKARDCDNKAKALVAAIKMPDLSEDTSAIDAAIQRADEDKTLALLRLAASADLPDKVAAWRNQAEVPNVTTLPAASAKGVLNNAGFSNIQFVAAGDPPPEGQGSTVAKQSPDPGSKVRKSTEITLYVYPAEGQEPVDVPKLAGLEAKTARAQLAELGLTMSPEAARDAPKSKAQEFTIASQSPDAGTKIVRGQAVIVRIFPEFKESEKENPPTTATNNPPATTPGRWYSLFNDGKEIGVRIYFEVTGELTAKAAIEIPTLFQAYAKQLFSVTSKEVKLDVTTRNGVYIVNLKPFTNKLEEWIRQESKKPRESRDGSILGMFSDGNNQGGPEDVVDITFDQAEVEVHIENPNLRLTPHVRMVLTSNKGTRKIPASADEEKKWNLIGKPAAQ